jgi:hypothetical protein
MPVFIAIILGTTFYEAITHTEDKWSGLFVAQFMLSAVTQETAAKGNRLTNCLTQPSKPLASKQASKQANQQIGLG